MSSQQQLIEKLTGKKAIIGVLGLGYVGLPLLLRFAEVGYHVIGFDIDEEKVSAINQGKSYFHHISDLLLQEKRQQIQASSDFSRVDEADALLICVPTPLTKYREPDLSYVRHTMDLITPQLRPGQILSLESTTYPGTTEEEILPRIISRGFTVGEDIFLVYSPEREDPANKYYSLADIPKICGGACEACIEVGIALYRDIVKTVVSVSSLKTAEMTKLLENIHRAVNIGLVNEMKIIADKMQVNIYEVINAAATKPFGFVPYYPGPGLGGHCIPIDPFYLTWKAREYGVHTRFIELAGEINSSMPAWVIGKIVAGLNQAEKSVKGSKILLNGMAYKRDVDDARESPAFAIIDALLEKGANVHYHDPYIATVPQVNHQGFDHTSKPLSPALIAQYDAVVIVTAHSDIDYDLIQQHAQLIIDTRGIYEHGYDNVISA